MSNNYFAPVDNHFGLGREVNIQEDFEDDLILRGSSRPINNVVTSGRSTNLYGGSDQQQLYAEERRKIEQRTLDSTYKSLSLLCETEEVGKATAVELAKQREQLENSSRHLDEINSSLRFSQRHLNGLKSVFGGLKNYLSGNYDFNSHRILSSPDDSNLTTEPSTRKTNNLYSVNDKLSNRHCDNQPISRLVDDGSKQLSKQRKQTSSFEMKLEGNLENMCENLSRLKGLATNLGTEIESQNELLDNMNYKIEDADLKITRQNKEMKKLL